MSTWTTKEEKKNVKYDSYEKEARKKKHSIIIKEFIEVKGLKYENLSIIYLLIREVMTFSIL